MPQMTPAQARVIDPVLTNIARGYKNAKFAGMALFPYVPVGQRGGKIITFGKEHFRLYNTGRAPGAKVARIQSSYGSQGYALEQHALSEGVPFELMEDANAVPGIDLGRAAVTRVQDIIGLTLEYAQATLARTAGNYASTNKVTLSGDTQWSKSTSDPVADVESFKEAVRGQIGIRPNTMVISGKVFAALKVHAKITDRIKYTSRDVATPELLAALFGLAKVEIGDAVYQTAAGVMTDVWGGDAVLGYTDMSGVADAGSPSYGYTYRLTGSPYVEEPYQERDSRSWVYQAIDDVQPVIAGADAGFLITAAV